MADIQKYLIQTAHKQKAKQEQQKMAACQRQSIEDYEADNLTFKLPLGKLKEQGGEMQQFNQFYFKRLE